VESSLKHEAERLFSTLGLSPSEAIALFYAQVTLHQGLPFSVKIPNAETREALRQARDEEGLAEYSSLDDLKAAHD
jgi:DNA-damage-inducible protein J